MKYFFFYFYFLFLGNLASSSVQQNSPSFPIHQLFNWQPLWLVDAEITWPCRSPEVASARALRIGSECSPKVGGQSSTRKRSVTRLSSNRQRFIFRNNQIYVAERPIRDGRSQFDCELLEEMHADEVCWKYLSVSVDGSVCERGIHCQVLNSEGAGQFISNIVFLGLASGLALGLWLHSDCHWRNFSNYVRDLLIDYWITCQFVIFRLIFIVWFIYWLIISKINLFYKSDNAIVAKKAWKSHYNLIIY